MKHGSLFSGIGGFDLAAQWMDWDNVFHCEWNPFGQKILKYYWPESISYEDITKTDFTIHRGNIDILTGGFPCQPFSSAGQRKGKEDDRYLWPEMLRAIKEIRPTWIVGENVAGLKSMGIEQGLFEVEGGEITIKEEIMVVEQIRQDLEKEGYELQPFIIPACAVNAPHRRDRIWFVALQRTIPNTCSNGSHWDKEFEEGCNGKPSGVSLHEPNALYGGGIVTDTKDNGCKWESRGCVDREERRVLQRLRFVEGGESIGSGKVSPNTNNQRLEGIRDNASMCGNNEGNVIGSTWDTWPTQSPVCDGDDGVSGRLDAITFSKWRKESIKAGGNAIVPQVIFQIFKAIQEYENLTTGQ